MTQKIISGFSHAGPEISEKFTKILDSGSPEADILEFLLEYHNPTEKDYQKIKTEISEIVFFVQ